MIATARTFVVQSQWPPRVAEAIVEVDVRAGLPSYTIVGIADRAVRESRERVRCALLNSGFEFPSTRITVNIAPAQVRRAGHEADLAIACALLRASGQLGGDRLASHALFGELLITGEVLASPGALAVAEHAVRAGAKALVVASGRGREATLAEGLEVIVADTLTSAARVLGGGAGDRLPAACAQSETALRDLSEIRGQREGVEALTLAAGGGHGLLLVGSPGCGSTMLARRLPGILPPLNHTEALAVTRLQSVVGLNRGDGLAYERPFRAPHHTISAAGLAGAGRRPGAVGEAQLADRGVLCLDELCEFSREALASLAGVLDSASPTAAYGPALGLVATVGPCPCGYLGHDGRCRCNETDLRRYRRRLDGALHGHFQIVAQLERPSPASDQAPGPTSAETRERVIHARARQHARAEDERALNATVDRGVLERHLALSPADKAFVRRTCLERRLCDRELDRLLRVARTAADLDDSPSVGEQHLALALSLIGGGEAVA